MRSSVTSAIEQARNDGKVGGSLQATISLCVNGATATALEGQDLAGLFIASSARMQIADVPEGAFATEEMPEVGVIVGQADGGKCQRCWKVLEEVTEQAPICGRCDEVVTSLESA